MLIELFWSGWSADDNFPGSLEELISSKMRKTECGEWVCLDCPYTNRYRQRLQYHIESKHVASPGHVCNICQKVCSTRNALCLHRSRHHKNIPF